MRKNQNKATRLLTAPAPPALSHCLRIVPLPLNPGLSEDQTGSLRFYFTHGETEDQRGEGPWSRSSKSEGRDLSSGLLPPGLTSGWGEEWALPRGLAGPRVQLWGQPGKEGPELGLHYSGRDVSHFPRDPELQTKAGRELFSEGGLSVGPRTSGGWKSAPHLGFCIKPYCLGHSPLLSG